MGLPAGPTLPPASSRGLEESRSISLKSIRIATKGLALALLLVGMGPSPLQSGPVLSASNLLGTLLGEARDELESGSSGSREEPATIQEGWPWHVLRAGPDGRQLAETASGEALPTVERLLEEGVEPALRSGGVHSLLVYVHGALTEEAELLERVRSYRDFFLPRGIYPLFLSWQSELAPALAGAAGLDALGVLGLDAVRLQGQLSEMLGLHGLGLPSQGVPPGPTDLLAGTLGDQVVENLADRPVTSRTWSELKARALAVVTGDDAVGTRLASGLKILRGRGLEFQLTLASHSTGALVAGHFAAHCQARQDSLQEAGFERQVPVRRCVLLAPACTVDFLEETLVPLRGPQAVGEIVVFNLNPEAEAADTLGVYSKSLLTFVEEVAERPRRPVAGLSTSFQESWRAGKLLDIGAIRLVQTPNTAPLESGKASRATRHVDFSTDAATLHSLAW